MELISWKDTWLICKISGDCSDLNIMMDGTNMYPGGFHPIAQFLEPSGRYSARYKLRANVSVKYYFIDFGLSTHFPDTDEPRLVTGSRCQDREAPELSEINPCDPFALDVFLLGNVYRSVFIKVRKPPLISHVCNLTKGL